MRSGKGEEDFVVTVGSGAGNNCGRGIFRHAIFNFRRKVYELASLSACQLLSVLHAFGSNDFQEGHIQYFQIKKNDLFFI